MLTQDLRDVGFCSGSGGNVGQITSFSRPQSPNLQKGTKPTCPISKAL